VSHTYLEQILYPNHPASRMETGASVEAITVENLRAFLEAWVQPAALVVAVSGDIERDEVAEALRPLLDGWEAKPLPARSVPAHPEALPPGVYVVDMPSEGAEILAAHQGFDERDPRYDPEFYATHLANQALGGTFESRLVATIRVQEGLAYDVYSSGMAAVGYPGVESAYAGVNANQAAYTARLMREGIEGLRAEAIGPEELARTKQSQFSYWLDFFSSPEGIADDYAGLLIDGQPLDHYGTWFPKLNALSAEQILTAARAHIRPEDLRWVIVGPAETVLKRDEAHGLALEELGPVRVLELGDPLQAVRIGE
jgi:zinc protease